MAAPTHDYIPAEILALFASPNDTLRHDWTPPEVLALFALPFADLLYQAQNIHRQNFDPNEVQISTLLNFKTGGCPENCSYCPQSAHYDTGVDKQPAMQLTEIIAAAEKAKAHGATRFCMGAAWRNPREKDFVQALEMIKAVKALGMETCATLGMLNDDQAKRLKEAGLDFYNHNLDSSPEYYATKVVTTRTYQDRLDTLQRVREAGMHVCCGGIVGMGETLNDRAGLLIQLANLPQHPVSVPINMLIRIPGTPLEDTKDLSPIEFVRTVAVARIMMPRSMVRLSAGRASMSPEMQALCFLAGANSIHYGEKLLVTENADMAADDNLFAELGLKSYQPSCLNNN